MPGADFNHTGARCGAAQLGHTGADRWIDEKILAQGLGKGEAIAGKQIPDHRNIGQILHDVLLKPAASREFLSIGLLYHKKPGDGTGRFPLC